MGYRNVIHCGNITEGLFPISNIYADTVFLDETLRQVDSFRSEDKPNVLLYGGLLQMEKFNYRSVNCISVPSVCGTTKEMNDKRYSNTIGAWYITIRTDDKGNFKSISAMDSVYYSTNKNDYQRSKVLKLTKEKC